MMKGTKVGMLEVVEVLPGSLVRCRCDCGGEKTVRKGHFNAGNYRSCGCHVTRHGHAANDNRSREYISYHNMLARCLNPANKRFNDYGARGITVCSRWRESFANFLTDMGPCPEGFTIDRKDNEKGYEPGNCHWVPRSVNQQNRRLSVRWIVDGVSYSTMSEAATAHGVSTATIAAWCKGRNARGKRYPPREGCRTERVYGEPHDEG